MTTRLMTVFDVLDEVEYKDGWRFHVVLRGEDIFVRAVFDAPDVHTGEVEAQYGRMWFIENPFDEEAVVKTCLLAVLVAEEHEAREMFRYRGERVGGPHGVLGR